MVVTLLATAVLWSGTAWGSVVPDHLVVSEIVTGGTSASDELIEIYNPTADPLPLEGLELVYVSASGLTVSRRATWPLGAPEVPPGAHVLVAHELGVYASIADATYGSGMAATGGSVALRIVGASSAIDAVGWGSAASAWMEGSAAIAPAAGSSLERLPGGALGSTQDTDDNAGDFVVRPVPGPENSGSPTVPQPVPSASPELSGSPSPSPTVDSTPSAQPSVAPSPTLAPTVSPSPTLGPTVAPSAGSGVVSIASARGVPDGTEVTVEGVALTDSTFADGGGYIADESGGIAVLLSGGSFARGERLRVSGTVDDRYAQRTLRADPADIVVLGTGGDPTPIQAPTGSVAEALEGRLVRIRGSVLGAPTALSAGIAFEVDDGSGAVRMLVGSGTGIDVSAWGAGYRVELVGVLGQRDSSGAGTSGYRLQPRDPADILAAGPGASPTPTPTPSASATAPASPEASQAADVISVAAARQLPKGASALVRGVVTLSPGLVDPTTAVLQDATGAIVLRVGEDAGPVVRGTLVEVRGVRATLSGMETLRVSQPARSLGAATEPVPLSLATGDAGEPEEALLVSVRGGLLAAPRRSSAGTISFEIDDGSGPLRVSIGSSAGVEAAALSAGSWVEVRGVLGQETTGSLPLRGYRVWPRSASDVLVTAPVVAGSGPAGSAGPDGDPRGSGAIRGGLGTLDAVDEAADAARPIGATLVVGPWDELGLGGLLWDGARLVGIDVDAGALVAGILGNGRPPLALQATGLRTTGVHDGTGLPLVGVSDRPGALQPSGLPPSPPLTGLDVDAQHEPRWVAIVARLSPGPSDPALLVDGRPLPLDMRCESGSLPVPSVVSVTGVLVANPTRLVVPCDGIVAAPVLHRVPISPITGGVRTLAGNARASRVDASSDLAPGLLLLLAATMLAVAAGIARWAPRGGGPAEAAAEESPDDAEVPVSPPTLTLVAMPRERAP